MYKLWIYSKTMSLMQSPKLNRVLWLNITSIIYVYEIYIYMSVLAKKNRKRSFFP